MSRNRTLSTALALVVLVPALVTGLGLWSLGDQVEDTDTLPAAVVNKDQPVEVRMQGEKRPIAMGRLLAGGLTSPTESEDRRLGWELADAEEAQEGLEEGRYHAVLTIPEGFSDSLAGIARNEPEQAGVTVRSNDSSGALLGPLTEDIGDVAASDVGRMLTVTYLEGLYDRTAQMKVQLGRAADGAGRVAGGASDLADGAEQLADGTERAGQGAGELADGVGRLSSGAGQLADGAGRLERGAGQVAEGADRLAAGNRRAARGADRLADGLGRMQRQLAPLPGQADRLADGAESLADGLEQLSGPVPDVDLSGALEQWRQQCPAMLREQLPDEAADQVPAEQVCDRIRQQLEERIGGTDQLEQLLSQLEQLPQGAQRLADGTRALASSAPRLVQGVQQARGGAQQLAKGNRRLARGAAQLSEGATDLQGGAARLSDGADQLAGGADSAASGASDLEDGIGQLGEGTGRLAGGADRIRSGTGELAKRLRQGADQVPDKSEGERKDDARAVAQPVTSESGRFAPASATEAMTPAALALALWLGAFVVYLLRPALSRDRLAAASSAVRTVLAGWRPGVILGLLQAGLLLPLLWLLDVGVARPIALALLVLPLAALSFVAVVQALVAVLGARGGWIAIAVLGVLQVLTTTGLLPIDSAPGPVRALHDVLPVPVAADLAQWAVLGTSTGVASGVLLLLVWGALGWGATTMAARHRSRLSLDDVRRVTLPR